MGEKMRCNPGDEVYPLLLGFPGGSVKNLPANAGDVGLIPGSGIFPGERNDNSL